MPVTEESRHRLHQKLDQTIGPEDATTLMEHLPPTGWADLPTRSEMNHRFDLVDQRFETVGVRLDEIDKRFASLEGRMETQMDRMIRHTWQVIGVITVVASLLMAAAKFL